MQFAIETDQPICVHPCGGMLGDACEGAIRCGDVLGVVDVGQCVTTVWIVECHVRMLWCVGSLIDQCFFWNMSSVPRF